MNTHRIDTEWRGLPRAVASRTFLAPGETPPGKSPIFPPRPEVSLPPISRPKPQI
jgi:hypothetical protein